MLKPTSLSAVSELVKEPDEGVTMSAVSQRWRDSQQDREEKTYP